MQPPREGPRILLLGPVQVAGGQREIRLGRRQRIALARLALEDGREVSIDSLIETVWEDARPRNARHALQAQLSRLRGVLGGGIEYVGRSYRLVDRALDSDLRRFTRLSEIGHTALSGARPERAIAAFDDALALWRGPALGDLDDVAGLHPFALRLEKMRRRASTERAEALLRVGRSASIIDELRTLLALDPLQETAWHQLIRALWQSGREADALAAYEQARRTLVEHLGIEPGSQLTELHASILASLPGPDDATAQTTASNSVGRADGAAALPAETDRRPRIVGRERELAVLQSLWDRGAAEIDVVTVSGDPGIGKTRLIDEFTRRAGSDEDWWVLRGRCELSATGTYQPLVHMLRRYVAGLRASDIDPDLHPWIPELARLAPELAGWFPGREPTGEGDPYRTMAALTAWLEVISRRHRLLLVVDDVHWADEQTLVFLRRLCTRGQGIRALLLLGLRDRQLPDDDGATGEMLRQSEVVTHLPLTRLTDAQIPELVAIEQERFTAAAPLPEWAVDYVRDGSGGNPLFVTELARQLLMLGAHVPEQMPDPPEGARRVIQGRIDRLPSAAQTFLRTAAVLGPEFELGMLIELAELPRPELMAGLDTAVHARLIEPVAGSLHRYSFSHDLVRLVLYESHPLLDRARLHGRIAEALETLADDDEAASHRQRAHHYRHSDHRDASLLAAGHLHHAGRHALTQGAPAEAEGLLRDGLDLLGGRARPDLRCDLLIGLGTAQLQQSQPQYRDSLLEASRIASSLDDTARLTSAVLLNNRGWWSNTLAVDHERIAHIESALTRTAAEDLTARCRLEIAWARENVRDPGMRRRVLERSAHALELAERSGDLRALAEVLSHRYAVMHALFDDPEGCVRTSERLLDLANRLGDPHVRLSAALGLSQATMRFGDCTTSDRYLAESIELADRLNHPARLWLATGWRAMRTAVRGRLEVAERLMLESFELGGRTGEADAPTWFAGQMFTLRMLQGRLGEFVEEARDQALAVADAIPSWRAALALALARSSRPEQREQAGAIVDHLARDSFAQIPRDTLRLHGLHYLTMACETLERADLAPTLYDLLLPHTGMIATNGTIDAGPVDLHLGVLARLRGRADVADRHLHAAAELARTCDARMWVIEAERRL